MQLKNSIISLLKLVAEKSATTFDDLPDCTRVKTVQISWSV